MAQIPPVNLPTKTRSQRFQLSFLAVIFNNAMQLTNDQKIFWRNDWFVHVTKQASPPLHPVSMRYLIGYEQQNHYEGLHFIEELFARADDDSTTITSIEHESGIVTVAINNVPITLTAPNLTTEEKLITILKLTQLQLVLTVDRSPLIDKIRVEFGFAGFEPYGRDRYTCFAHPIILGDDGKDYGLEENGAEYIASSQYKHYGPDTLGTPGETDNWMHFNNEGTKWLGWRIPSAKRIRSIQFHSGGNNNYNVDFMQRVVLTLWQNGRVLKTLVHTFQPVSSFAIENYTPLEVVKL